MLWHRRTWPLLAIAAFIRGHAMHAHQNSHGLYLQTMTLIRRHAMHCAPEGPSGGAVELLQVRGAPGGEHAHAGHEQEGRWRKQRPGPGAGRVQQCSCHRHACAACMDGLIRLPCACQRSLSARVRAKSSSIPVGQACSGGILAGKSNFSHT